MAGPNAYLTPDGPGGTIYDVAREAGVSIGTVSKVFNDKPDVSRKTRRLVLDAARKVHYMPVMRSRRVSIGLFVEDLNRINEVGYVSQIVFSIARQVTRHGGVLELVSLNDIDAIYKNHVSGVIAVVFRPHEKLEQLNTVPVVLVNNRIDLPNLHSVASDHRDGGYQAARHLIDAGHERIGFLEMVEDAWGSRERQAGYLMAMDEAGLPVDELMRFTQMQSPRASIESLLEQRATALLVCGEDLSLQVNDLLLHHFRLSIPDDLSLIAAEVPYVSSILSPPQTTIAQPWSELGTGAVEVLMQVLQKQADTPIHRLLPNELIVRQSVQSRVKAGGGR
jgi:LacI family transcriptional regulator